MMRRGSVISLIAAGLATLAGPAGACDAECGARIDTLAGAALARDQSVAAGRNNAVVLQHGAGLPVLKCRPLNFCSIRLEPGEVLLEDLALGDTVLWSAEVRVAGSRETPHVRILVKPDAAATQTSLVIATDRRFYDIQLIKSDAEYTPIMAFAYPQDVAAATRARIAEDEAARTARREAEDVRVAVEEARQSLPVGDRQVFAGDLDFDFVISGKAPFKPTRVFTDGSKTWIDLPGNYRGEKPVFLTASPEGDGVVNSRWTHIPGAPRANRLEIDRVIRAGTLMLGVGRQALKITIHRSRR